MVPQNTIPLLILVLFLGQVRVVSATGYTWNGGGIGTWDTSSNNWTGAASTPLWDITSGTNNVALFNANADTATVSGTVYANGVTFNAAAFTNTAVVGGTLTLGGLSPTISYGVVTAAINSAVSATPAVSISGSSGGRLRLGGNNAFAGGVTANGGYVVMDNNNGLGYRTPLMVSNATVDLNGRSPAFSSITLNNGICGIPWSGNLYLYNANPVITSDGISSIKPSEIWNGYGAGVNFTFAVNSGTNTIGLNNSFLRGGGNNTLTKSGSGMMIIQVQNSNGNQYTNALTISGGIFSVDRLYDANKTGTGLGDSVNDATNLVLNGGTLQFTGANNNDGAGKVRNITDRLFSLGTSGGAIDASGTAPVLFTNTASMGFNNQSGARTLTLTGSNASTNTLAVTIGDNGGPTTLIKAGTGSWTISGTNAYSGATVITNGVLALTHSTCLGTNTDVYIHSGATNNLNFTGTNVVHALYLNGMLMPAAIYGSANIPSYITGSGKLQAVSGGAYSNVIWTGAVDNNWTNAGNWSGGTPGIKVVVYDTPSVANLSQTPGANISIAGIKVIDPAGDILITNAANMLTIAEAGIDMSAATKMLTLSNLTLSASQEWKVTGSGVLTNAVSGTIINGGYTLTITNTTNVYVRAISGSGGVIKNGSGNLYYLSQGSYTGGTIVNGGTIQNAGGVNGLGPTWYPVTINNATWSLNGVSPSVGTLTLSNGTAGVGNSGNLYSSNVVSRGSSAITVSEVVFPVGSSGYGTNVFDVVDGTLTINGWNRFAEANKAAQTSSVVKVGNGTIVVLNLNSTNKIYGGATIIGGGVWQAATLANGGANNFSHIGTSSSAAENLVLKNGGTLKYTGGAVSIDRLFSLGPGGGALDASGTGALGFTNTGAMGFVNSGAHTLTLTGSNTGTNTLAVSIGDNGGPTTLVKAGTGTWIIAGTNTYSGPTIITAGVLKLTHSACLGAGTAVYISAGATNDLNFTGTNVVSALYLNGELKPIGVYDSGNAPQYITGSGKFLTTGPADSMVFRFY